MIKLNHVNLYRNDKKILNNINLTLSAGETVVLTGQSGSGKSSLISLLNGLIPELYEGMVEGSATVLNTTLPAIDFNEYVKHIGVVFQNPKTQFFTTSVISELAFSMENYGIEPSKIESRMSEIITIFELESLVGKKVTELSGGQKQRIAFASACMLPHRLFLFDEPSSNLDYETISKLSDYLKVLKSQGHTMIISEHRLFYLKELADRFVILKNGEIVLDKQRDDFIYQFDVFQEKFGLRTFNEKELVIDKKNVEKDLSNKHMLEIDQMFFGYKHQEEFIHISNLALDTSNIIGLIGENGSGKSTFTQILTGLLPCKDVQIKLDGQLLTSKERLHRSFMVMQDVNLQLFFETVEKELLVHSKREELFDEVVEELSLSDLLSRHPQDLSGGEKQRVAIASAILSGKDWIILDEPTSGLDYKNMIAVSHLLKKVQQYGLFILIISHDNEFLSKTTPHIIKMNKGRIDN